MDKARIDKYLPLKIGGEIETAHQGRVEILVSAGTQSGPANLVPMMQEVTDLFEHSFGSCKVKFLFKLN